MDGRLLFHDSKPSSKLGLNADSVIRRGLNSLLAAASYAKRPTAPRRKSIVPGWIAVSFQFDLVPAQSDAVHHQLPPLIPPYHQVLLNLLEKHFFHSIVIHDQHDHVDRFATDL
jgi:hypothetical protein